MCLATKQHSVCFAYRDENYLIFLLLIDCIEFDAKKLWYHELQYIEKFLSGIIMKICYCVL